MPSRYIRTVSLSGELDRYVSDQVHSGLYSSASEVVRAGLRCLARSEPKPGKASEKSTKAP